MDIVLQLQQPPTGGCFFWLSPNYVKSTPPASHHWQLPNWKQPLAVRCRESLIGRKNKWIVIVNPPQSSCGFGVLSWFWVNNLDNNKSWYSSVKTSHYALPGRYDCHESRFSIVWNVFIFTKGHKLLWYQYCNLTNYHNHQTKIIFFFKMVKNCIKLSKEF